VTLDDIKTFYKKHYGPAHLRLVFVGDIDRKLIESELKKRFTGWSGGVAPLRTDPAAHGALRTLPEQKISIARQTTITALPGQSTGLRYEDKDALALRLATSALGAGFTSRLTSTVRDTEGLTYSINASVGNDAIVDGTFAITASFAPTLLDQGIASTQ